MRVFVVLNHVMKYSKTLRNARGVLSGSPEETHNELSPSRRRFSPRYQNLHRGHIRLPRA